MAYVDWLTEGRLSRDVAGGKGASLSELIAAGFTVPPGFVINAEGYRHFVEVAGLNARIDVVLRNADLALPAAASQAASEISALIGSTTLPDDLREEIAAAYDGLTAKTGHASAVRSSAISEDGEGSSFAGLYESFLNVVGITDVIARVRQCYASLWSDRAVRYRAARTEGSEDEAMAVVIMGLVQADVSGVAFTVHPVTGSLDQVIINSSWGLGEAIVSGLVTPDSFVLEKGSFAILEREIYDKEMAILPDPSGMGTIETDLEPAKASAPSLQDEEAIEVARMAVRVEGHYGSPQDIEWGIRAGQLYLLQSRPITTL